jgi:probable F420-dependent oxidoreductase
MELRFGDKSEAAETAAELDELGFGTLWIPGGIDGEVLADVDRLLSATKRITVATGILNIWKHNPNDVAAWYKALPAAWQNRVMIGLGVSHGPIIGDAWKNPLAAVRRFLDGLEQAGMPRDKLCLAALGPKMLELSRDRTAGAHPYLVTPEHTAQAREILGPGKLLAPEQGVILERDPTAARAIAREALTIYAQLPNYRNNWLRLGLSLDDIDTASDRLVDALFAWGTTERIVERVKAHYQAGADHVCVQVIRGATGGDMAGLRAACRELAGGLL